MARSKNIVFSEENNPEAIKIGKYRRLCLFSVLIDIYNLIYFQRFCGFINIINGKTNNI